ncbi:hypothetical protein QQ045_021198 [Rhodiola kirilowii]
MFDVGNIEGWSNSSSTPRQKKLNLDSDEPQVSSISWPPVILHSEEAMNEEDKEIGGDGEWVDKVMVNKLDASSKVGNPLGGCCEASSSPFGQKYLYKEPSYNTLFTGNNRFDITKSDVLDDDVGTSDSSERDLPWQHNHATKIPSISAATGSRIPRIANGIGLKTPTAKDSKLRNLNSRISQSPAEKFITSSATPNRARRLQLLSDGKHKVGTRKQ